MRSWSARRPVVLMAVALAGSLSCASVFVAAASAGPMPRRAPAGPSATCHPPHPGALGYHANLADGTVSIIDVANKTEIGTIGGFHFPWDTQITHDGSTLFVNEAPPTNLAQDDVAVVDLCQRRIVKRIPTLSMAFDLISPDGTKLYATNLTVGGVQEIDTATARVDRVFVTLPLTQEAVSADGRTLWLVALPDEVYSLDMATGLPNGLPVNLTGINPAQFAISPDGRQLAVADLTSGDVALVDTRTRQVRTVPLGLTSYPSFAIFSPDSRFAWIAEYSGHVAVVDTVTGTVAHTITTAGWTTGVNFSQDGATAFVTTTPPGSTYPPFGVAYIVPVLLNAWRPGGQLQVYDAHTYVKTATIATGNVPVGVAIPLP